jgi:hypothetical protein
MAEIAMGNLYDLNKTAMKKVNPLDFAGQNEGKKVIKSLFFEGGNHYYMLLNRERADYTVIEVPNITYAGEMAGECMSCLRNRGKILTIDRENPEISAIEIWIRGLDDENYMYMLFPCDAMIVSPNNKE